MFGGPSPSAPSWSTGDYPNDQSFIHAAQPDRFVAEVGIRSMVVAPLVAGDRVFGAMGTFSTRPDAFNDAQIALVRALADHAAAAMANARLIEELDRSRAELPSGPRSSARCARSPPASRPPRPASVLQHTVDEAARLLGADGARIDLIDAESGCSAGRTPSGARSPTTRSGRTIPTSRSNRASPARRSSRRGRSAPATTA